MSDLRLSLAINYYAHTEAIASGRIAPAGIDLTVMHLPFEEIANRFARFLEFDIAEFSLGNYCARLAAGTAQMVGIPVFTSRAFRMSSIYVAEDSPFTGAADLAGRRVGVPQWSQTATIYIRGDLEHRYGAPVTSIDWFQGGVEQTGRRETTEMHLPDGIRLHRVPDRTLTEMLLAGNIDAVITARPPTHFRTGTPGIRRLYPDYRTEEAAMFRESGVFPIMHVIAIRRDVFERNRWVARNLFEAFEASKRDCLERMADIQFSFLPTAWGPDDLRLVQEQLFPTIGFPYGLIEPNRTTLEAFVRYCFEQGVTAKRLSVDELFPPESLFETHI